jgi:prephenate dehydratase
LRAYSEIAGKNIFPNSESIPCKTFEEMFEVVRTKKVDRAIVPIENSLAGRVADTQRLIPDSGLKIIGEYFLEIKHCLLAGKNASIKTLKRVHSHEQALAQCRKNLLTKDVSMVVAADTAGAAKEIAKLNNLEDGAVASKLSAEIYRLKILQEDIQDSVKNYTRFVIMSNESELISTDEKNVVTTIVYEVRSIPAALYKSLGGFATNGINITKLESYIHPQGFDVAQFYVDIEGHPENPSVKLAIDDLKFYSKKYDILGVYKAAEFRKK